MEWHSTQQLLPKRDGKHEDFSADVLTYSDDGFFAGYYRYSSQRWVFLDIDGEDMLDDFEDFDHSAVMWAYLPEAPAVISTCSVKIDGE